MKRCVGWVVATAGTAVATLLPLTATAAAAAPGKATVSYLGHNFTVPSSWPVVDLAAHPGTCVRFDRHALYLGTPSADQDCPSRVIGRTEAVLVEPVAGTGASSTTDNSISQQLTVSATGVRVTATYDRDPGLVRGIVASAGLATNGSSAMSPRVTAAPAAISTAATSYSGTGFDACAAPSASTMNAWLSSPYRAIGIYIGGAQRGCAQPNLTSAWVSAQAQAGWHFIPLYVGPQASVGQITSPTSQGTGAADDAANQATALGFGPGTPIYYDMEAYGADQAAAALAFESAWSTELHNRGYLSGYYSSSGSGITDLVANYPNYVMPDILDVANWNGVASTDDPAVPSYRWANHQRIHQYTGGGTETYGGVQINIDHDYLDVVSGSELLSGGGSNTASQTTTQPDGTVDMFYRGVDGGLWTSHNDGSGWPVSPTELPRTAGTLASQPSAVTSTRGVVDVFYKATDGNLWHVWYTLGVWRGPQSLGDGPLGGPPRAVAQSSGTVDVFWRGTDAGIWHAWYVNGFGWQGPENLGGTGTLASDPSPTISSAGVLDVFYRRTDNVLWHRWYQAGWRGPGSIGQGPLNGTPQAVGQPDGTVDVFWRGSNNGIGHSWYNAYGWQGPQNLGGTLSADPVTVTSAPGVVFVLYRGSDNNLWSASYSGGWLLPATLNLGPLAGPMSASAIRNGTINVFWPASDGGLRYAQYRSGFGWSTALDLGGAGTYAVG
jgi:glycoside hydrolase-like protein